MIPQSRPAILMAKSIEMEDLFIQNTLSTPEIQFSTSGTLIIKGTSRPEDSRYFYRHALNWLNEYGQQSCKVTTLSLNFSYIDTSSVRSMVDFIKAMTKLEQRGFEAIVNWYYEEGDDDLFDVGDALRSNTKLRVNLVELDTDEGFISKSEQ